MFMELNNMEKSSIYKKLLECQKEIGAIKKDASNPFFKSKYFDINGLLAVVKPVLNKHGLIIVQGLNSMAGLLSLDTRIYNEDGEFINFECPITTISDPQKQGSAITYFRRYALQSLLALEAQDDDGNTASDNKPSKDKEIPQVESFMQDLEPTDDEIKLWRIKLENCETLKALKDTWKITPPMVQEVIATFKDELKAKLGGK